MPRALIALLLLLAPAGCTDGNAPPALITDGGPDQSASIAPDLGGTCTTACDCPDGQVCRMGKCEMPTTAPVICCASASCTGTAVCELPNGNVSQCDHADGGGVTPIVDGGVVTNKCEMTRCVKGPGSDLFCRLACGGTATCVGTGGNEHCMP